MTLLTENDWSRIQSALSHMESDSIQRTYEPTGVRVRVSTRPVDKPWKVAMVVTVKVWFRGGEWHQHCESVEEARRVLRGWKGWQT